MSANNFFCNQVKRLQFYSIFKYFKSTLKVCRELSEDPAMSNDLHDIFKNPKWFHREVDRKSEKYGRCATNFIDLFKCMFSCRCYFKCLLVLKKPWYWNPIDRIFYKCLTRFFAYKDTWIYNLNSENVWLIPNGNTQWL